MNKKIAKTVSLALASTMLIGTVATMTGCKKKGSDKPVVAEDAEWFDTTKIKLESPYDKDDVAMVEFDSPVYLNDSIYVILVGERTFDINAASTDPDFDYNQYIINSVCKYDLDGKLVKEYNLDNFTGDDVFQATKLTVEDGKLKIACLSADANSEATSNYYAIMDPDSGEIIDSYDLKICDGTMSVIQSEFQVGDYTIYNVYDISDDGSLSNKIVISEGKEVTSEIDINKVAGREFYSIGNYIVVDEDTVIMSCSGDQEYTGKLSVSTGKMTFEQGENDYSEYYFEMTQDGTSAAVNSKGIWKINDDLQPEMVMSFSSAYCNAADAEACRVSYIDDETIVIYGMEYISSVIPDSYVYIFNKADSNPNAGKTILDVYTLDDSISYSEAEAVVKFNSTNDKYYATIRYSESDGGIEDTTSISDALMVDLMSGDGPDVVLNGAGVSQLNNSEYFVDLMPLIDGDNGINRDDYYSAIFDGAKNSDGALYQIPVTFSVEGILAYKKDVASGKVGFTYDEYNKFVDEVCNGKSPIEWDQCEFILEAISSGAVTYTVDGKVNFDTNEFRKLAEFTNEYIKINPEGDEEGMGMGMFGGGALDDGGIYYTAESPLYFFSIIGTIKDPVALYGIPSEDGRGAGVKILSSAAISANADEETQKAAWEFIKAMLSEEVQTSELYGNPINKKAAATLTHQGIEIYNEQYYLLVNMGMTEAMLKLSGISLMDESFVQDYLDILDSASSVYTCDTAVCAIVMEELAPYFEGQKSLDQVIQTLNDRAQTVVNERASA